MHILYLHQYFVPREGDGGTRSYEMAKRFVRAGHKVTLITSYARFPQKDIFNDPVTSLDIDGIDIKVLKVPYSNNMSFARRIFAFFSFAIRSSIEALKVKDIDVVFATSTPLTIAIPGVVSSRFRKCPMVFEVRDLWPELPIAVGALKNPVTKWAAKRLEGFAYHHSKAIVALSPGMKAGIVKTGYPEDNVSVIPNSCDTDLLLVPESRGRDFMSKHDELSGQALVTYAGTLGLINGVGYLVEIAAQMLEINAGIKFVIVGEGKEKEKVTAKAEKFKVLGKNLFFYPPMAKEEIPDLLSATTVATSLFVDLPEMWNNSANKFFDALAAGRPLMINYQGWQADILQRSGAGVVVSSRDPKQAALKLNAFIQDKNRIENARKAAMELAVESFNRDKSGQDLISIIENIQACSQVAKRG